MNVARRFAPPIASHRHHRLSSSPTGDGGGRFWWNTIYKGWGKGKGQKREDEHGDGDGWLGFIFISTCMGFVNHPVKGEGSTRVV